MRDRGAAERRTGTGRQHAMTTHGSARAPSAGRAPARWVRRVLAFLRDRRANSAVEFALGLPIMLLIFVGIVDFGGLFYLKSEMTNAARLAARGLAVGEVTESEAVQLVQEVLDSWPATFSASTRMPDPGNPDDTRVSVTVSVPMSDAVLIDMPMMDSAVFDGTLVTEVSVRQE